MEPRFFEITDTVYVDHRGWAAFALDKLPVDIDLDPASLHVVMTNPGGIRGNHAHPYAAEWLYVYEGEFNFCWGSTPESTKNSRRLAGRNTLVRIPPGLAHTLVNVGNGPAWLVAVRERPAQSTDEHTRPVELIE